MNFAIREVPDEPRIDGAEKELALFGASAGFGNVFEHPGDFGGGEIRIEQEAGLLPDGLLHAFVAQAFAEGRGAAILPDDGVANRLAGLAIPDDGGFALVGGAKGCDVARADARFAENFDSSRKLRSENVERIVLNPAGCWKNLREFVLRDAGDGAARIEEDGAGTGGSLIESEDIGHGGSPRDFTPREPREGQ